MAAGHQINAHPPARFLKKPNPFARARIALWSQAVAGHMVTKIMAGGNKVAGNQSRHPMLDSRIGDMRRGREALHR